MYWQSTQRVVYPTTSANPFLHFFLQSDRSVLMRIVKYVSLAHWKLISLHKLSLWINSIINMMDGLSWKFTLITYLLFSLWPLTQPFLPHFSLRLPLFLKSYLSFFFSFLARQLRCLFFSSYSRRAWCLTVVCGAGALSHVFQSHWVEECVHHWSWLQSVGRLCGVIDWSSAEWPETKRTYRVILADHTAPL